MNSGRKRLSLGKDKTENLKQTLGFVPKSRTTVKKPQQNFSGFSHSRRKNTAFTRPKDSRSRQFVRPEAKEAKKLEVVLRRPLSVAELAMRMQKKVPALVEALANIGTKVTTDEVLDLEMAQLVVEELGSTCRVEVSKRDESSLIESDEKDKEEDLRPRFPVVTIMGHVDHGKTTLLDTLGSYAMAKKEEGGITQDIRAFCVDLPSAGGKPRGVVFLDTPGHEAFSGIRFKGAEFADIVLLIVAADDSVRPQTVDSISYAKKLGKPMIVAVTKCDLEGVSPKKILSDLVQHEVIDESLGGDVLSVEISAKKKTGLEALLETLLLQAELLNLKANPNRKAKGVVVDSYMEKGRGSSATVLIQTGTLKKGDIVVAGSAWGKVRSIRNSQGKNMKQAGPGIPVQILGLDSLPQMGDFLITVEKEATARALAKLRIEKALEENIKRKRKVGAALLEDQDEQKKVFFVVKGAVHASLSSVISSLETLGNDELKVEVVQGDVGEISEKDVDLARASGAVVLGFGAMVDSKAKSKASMEGVEIVCDKIIYRLLDKAREICKVALGTERKETHLGKCKVIQVFTVSKVGNIAGSEVTDGKIKIGNSARVTRDGKVICEGQVKDLQVSGGRVQTGKAGMQCGVLIEGYDDINLDDTIEVFLVENVQKTLSEA